MRQRYKEQASANVRGSKILLLCIWRDAQFWGDPSSRDTFDALDRWRRAATECTQFTAAQPCPAAPQHLRIAMPQKWHAMSGGNTGYDTNDVSFEVDLVQKLSTPNGDIENGWLSFA